MTRCAHAHTMTFGPNTAQCSACSARWALDPIRGWKLLTPAVPR